MTGETRVLQGALREGRSVSLAHMRAMEHARLNWKEETITDLLLGAVCGVYPDMHAVEFTRHEESRVGADWLWWFVDHDGCSFGTLVQAKRLWVTGSRWHFRIDPEQRRRLLDTARSHDLAPAYVLYLGSPEYRGDSESGTSAETCRRTVSVTPALGLFVDLLADRQSTHEFSTPLEDVASAEPGPFAVFGSMARYFSSDLMDFIREPQTGARAVARALLRPLLIQRSGQFSLAATAVTPLSETLEAVFRELPDDRGHFDEPYLPNVLRGLLQSPPGYVVNVMHGWPVSESFPDSVRGIVVVRTSARSTRGEEV